MAFFAFRFALLHCFAFPSRILLRYATNAFLDNKLPLLLHKPNAFWHNIGCWPRWFELLKIILDLRSEKSHDHCSLLVQRRMVMIVDDFVFKNRNPSSCALDNILQDIEILIAFPTRFIMHLLKNSVFKMKLLLHPSRFRMDSRVKKTIYRLHHSSPGINPLWKRLHKDLL